MSRIEGAVLAIFFVCVYKYRSQALQTSTLCIGRGCYAVAGVKKYMLFYGFRETGKGKDSASNMWMSGLAFFCLCLA